MLSKNLRPWVAAVPQSGWGGTTLAGYVEAIGLRPDAAGDETECRQVLDALVAAGHAQTVGDDRWELTEQGHEALTAFIEPDESVTAGAVLLELQPGIGLSAAEAQA